MRIRIIAVGRLKSGPESKLVADYLARLEGLGRSVGLSQVRQMEVMEAKTSAAVRKTEEAKGLVAALPAGAYRAVLDERGEALSTKAFAGWLRRHIDGGTADLAFLIGGPDGHHASLLESAGKIVSLGAMTWPHRLIRVMLAEQIYRAVTIMVNHPYHRP